MKPPYAFKITDPNKGFSECLGCDRWRHCLAFFHNGDNWVLCRDCYEEYWFNEDELNPDYRSPTNHKKRDRILR